MKNLFSLTTLKLKATPFGIIKIELGDSGGRITFSPEPDIDPMRLIQLLQSRPQEFRLDGQERLKVVKKLPELDDRMTLIDELLRHFTHK